MLVVDDERDGREAVGAILKRRGAEPTLAGSTEEALELARQSPPDVVLTDIEMPGEDGYALLRHLRAAEGLERKTAVAALTAYASPQDRARALDAGFDIHIAKPIRADVLVATVAELFRDVVIGQARRSARPARPQAPA